MKGFGGPNFTVTAGVEAPVTPASPMFTVVWMRGGTSAHLDKHLRVQSNSTPKAGKCLDTSACVCVCVCVCVRVCVCMWVYVCLFVYLFIYWIPIS